LRPAPGLRRQMASWEQGAARVPGMLAPDRFHFLNEEHAVSSAEDWNNPAVANLWLYNLHEFDGLNAEGAETRRDWHMALFGRWIAENPVGFGNGWEPYPISLRVVNWITWHLSVGELSKRAIQSLAVQVRFLGGRLEYHLLGNHLWANAKALVFAGLFFDGPEADSWLRKGLELLGQEIPEQILTDGGHFERSPMYHSIVLEDLLDLVNLYRVYGRPVPDGWLEGIERMRIWLAAMSHPDGRIALFNDAAFGIASEPEALEAYARRLGFGALSPCQGSVSHFPQTGYVRLEAGPAVAVLDVATIGPDYIPGHAHADTLNFELSLFGQRLIVDTGTSTYEKNAERQRQRGTSAHNTVQVNGEDSSEVWGGFRVARRARPFGLDIVETAETVRVVCAHDGYRRLPGRPVHRRCWTLTQNSLTVEDRVEGAYREAIARYHFHPDVRLTGADGVWIAALPRGGAARIEVVAGEASLQQSTWHPEFNRSLDNSCLWVALKEGTATVRFVWHEDSVSH
ncbi:MAG: heparinase, partial [Candidatus Zixiibacteriota bacterium]